MGRGKFIVVEGPDGAGKSTLAGALAARLRERGLEVVQVREPGGTPVAEAARTIVLDPDLEVSPRAELFLYLVARADHVAVVIEPALASGKTVLSDRFELATFAYQIAGRGLPDEAVRAANRLATGGLTPDLTIVIDLPAEASRSRLETAGKKLDRLDEAGDELHARVDEAFRKMVGESIVHVDGTRRPAEVLHEAMVHLNRLFD